MAALDVIVGKLVAFWTVPGVRQNFCWVFILTSLAGSLVKELQVVPQSYFSSSSNVLNV